MQKYRKDYSVDSYFRVRQHVQVAVMPVIVTNIHGSMWNDLNKSDILALDFQTSIFNCLNCYKDQVGLELDIQPLQMTNSNLLVVSQDTQNVKNIEAARVLGVDGLVCLEVSLPILIEDRIIPDLNTFLHTFFRLYSYTLTIQIFDANTDRVIWRCVIRDALSNFHSLKKISSVIIKECGTMPYFSKVYN